MNIETIIEWVFFIFFLCVAFFLALGIISIVEIVSYILGNGATEETKFTVYAIVAAIVLFIVNMVAKRMGNINKFI